MTDVKRILEGTNDGKRWGKVVGTGSCRTQVPDHNQSNTTPNTTIMANNQFMMNKSHVAPISRIDSKCHAFQTLVGARSRGSGKHSG